ncbi:hypothetical protein BDQ17DRAFT_1394767 [Cyathus striatus]|nr:hypothetical protein BDQ17DRAFT_1394767 [Cyathus striatus]
MVSSTVNVVRYSALFGGIAYGFFHRRSLQADHDLHKLEHAVHERQRKKEAALDTTLVTDPEDPRFDLEKLIAKWEKSS